MLSRSLLPLSRLRLAQPATRIAATTFQSRSYARPRDYYLGDQGDYKLPSTAHRQPWQQTSSFASKPPKEPLRRVPGNEEDLKPDDRDAFESRTERTNRQPPQDAFDELESQEPSRPPQTSRTSGQPTEESDMLESDAPPQQPLLDLTKGIPSTLAAELEKAQSQQPSSKRSLNITEDPSEPSVGDGDGPGDRAPREEYVSSSDKKKNAAVKYTYLILAAAVAGYTAYLGRNWESEEEETKHRDAPSGWGLGLFYNRVVARTTSTMSYYKDPVTRKLLPDQDKDSPFPAPPFTLVLSLEDMLVHQEWSREQGWRIAKRPGVDYFLRYLSQYYELVVFTSQPSAMGDQVMRKLDPYLMAPTPLYREATLYKDGGYIKDLAYLNRDLKKVIIIDTDPHHVKHQPENAILLPKWKGDPSDQTLVQLIPFLEYVASMGFDDARTVLQSFEGKYIPAEFARREKLLREKFEQQQAAKGKPKRALRVNSWFKQQSPDGLPSLEEAEAQGKMYWDLIQERGQLRYRELEKRIKEEGDKWLAEKEAEEKRFQEEALKNMKSGWFGGFGGKKE